MYISSLHILVYIRNVSILNYHFVGGVVWNAILVNHFETRSIKSEGYEQQIVLHFSCKSLTLNFNGAIELSYTECLKEIT